MSSLSELTGQDFTKGIPLSDIPDGGMLGGHAHGKAVLLARRGDEVFAVGATCTHYSGPLAKGLTVGDTVHCPWHHACFSLRTGEAVGAPALNPLARWAVERRGGSVFVAKELAAAVSRHDAAVASSRDVPASVVIVGAGAAGDAAAEMLRREGYDGPITMIGADKDAPYDRPNLSKDYLAGTAQEEWIPLRPSTHYEELKVRLVLGKAVTAIEPNRTRVVLDDGTDLRFGALLLATGASPVRLPTPVEDGQVCYLRTFEDSRTIITAAQSARRAVVIGASFIGLEVAASLRARGLEVHVVAPESYPLERIMGRALSDMVRALHESHGVVFHLGRTARTIGADVFLDDGMRLPADVVVVVLVSDRTTSWLRRQDWLWTAAWSWTISWRRARRGFSRPATLRAIPTPARGTAFASSTGFTRSVRGRPPRATCWEQRSGSTRCRSSGASITTCRSRTSVTRRSGTGSHRRESRGTRLCAFLHRGQAHPRGRDGRPGSSEP